MRSGCSIGTPRDTTRSAEQTGIESEFEQARCERNSTIATVPWQSATVPQTTRCSSTTIPPIVCYSTFTVRQIVPWTVRPRDPDCPRDVQKIVSHPKPSGSHSNKNQLLSNLVKMFLSQLVSYLQEIITQFKVNPRENKMGGKNTQERTQDMNLPRSTKLWGIRRFLR